MSDDNGQIVALLTQIRDNQKLAIDLQRSALDRHQSHVRRYYAIVAVVFALIGVFAYEIFHH